MITFPNWISILLVFLVFALACIAIAMMIPSLIRNWIDFLDYWRRRPRVLKLRVSDDDFNSKWENTNQRCPKCGAFPGSVIYTITPHAGCTGMKFKLFHCKVCEADWEE